MWLLDRGLLQAEQRATLEREVLALRSLQELVRWAFAQQPPRDVSDVVVQDEFSHDVVIPWTAPVYLAFDTT